MGQLVSKVADNEHCISAKSPMRQMHSQNKKCTALVQVEQVELPSRKVVCTVVLISYFLVTAGVAYDIINEPPALGAESDPVTGQTPATRQPGMLMFETAGLTLVVVFGTLPASQSDTSGAVLSAHSF